MVEQVGEPLNLWKLEGDAVLAYSTGRFPTGDTFLGICENLYNAFAKRRLDIVANTTCPCRACANVGNLGLKLMAHHGTFEKMNIGPITDLSGADIILVHRMAKTEVKTATGIESYALFTEAAIQEMGIEAALVPYSQPFEHFGEVQMQVYDLGAAWERFRNRHERHYIGPDEGAFTYRQDFPHAPGLVWDGLVDPELTRQWMGLISVVADAPEGRFAAGARYHCVHSETEFFYWVTDWRPFDYFSVKFADPFHPGLEYHETYELEPGENGTVLRYSMGPAIDDKGVAQDGASEENIAFIKGFWDQTFPVLSQMLASKEAEAAE
jgi:uncharacterized protein YndB with AHSA1/START domain